MKAKRSTLILLICVLIMAAVCIGLFFLRNSYSKKKAEADSHVAAEIEQAQKSEVAKNISLADKVAPEEVLEGINVSELLKKRFRTAADLEETLKIGLKEIRSPEDISYLLEGLKLEKPTDEDLNTLFAKIGINGRNLAEGDFIQEIGEIKRRKKTRMTIMLKNGERIFFDISDDEEKGWKLDKVYAGTISSSNVDSILEEGNAAQSDGLLVSHSFVNYAIQKEFKKAKQLTDPKHLSDVQFAGLCILFEEGGYSLRNPRGVLTSVTRPKHAGYSVYLNDKEGSEAQFSLILKRKEEQGSWKVNEVNFDRLLSDFITKNGGDSYYTPFVKNPKGGDSIVVYFDFNGKDLSLRTKKQLSIVANILKWDEKKKITLTGHTDDLGSDTYNKDLSIKRAEAVRKYIVSEGVADSQVQTIGFGKHRPRKANKRDDGTDSPEGRQANRRAEIYLDF